jgi:AcrR family transcriptional regulator
MARKTHADWFNAAADLLATHGAQALTIDRLVAALNVTKGSFYHHFDDLAAFKTAFLAFIEHADSTAAIAHIEHAITPLARLQTMFAIASDYPASLALAMQAWALQDAQVKAVQARVYERQLAYATLLFEALIPDAAQARLVAQMALTVLVGSLHLREHLPKTARKRFFDELVRVYIAQERIQ